MGLYDSYAAIYDAIGQDRFGGMLASQELRRHGAPGRVLDLACGTGAAALTFAAAGSTVVGVDRSPAMLEVARAKAAEQNLPVTLIHADLRRLPMLARRPGELTLDSPAKALIPGSFDLVVSFADSLNYLLEDDDFAIVCTGVAELLRPGGRFVFDVNTEAEYRNWRDIDRVVRDDANYLVINRLRYDASRRLATGRIVWFARVGERWWRGEETHIERAWSDEELLAAGEGTGLVLRSRRTSTGEEAGDGVLRIVYEWVKG